MMPAVPNGNLVRRSGHACRPVRFTGRALEAGDLDDVIALHHAVRETVSPDLLFYESDAFFADHISRIGRIAGLFAEGDLIAYGVLGLPGPQDPNFGDELALSPAAKARVAAVDGVSVALEWRGNGLHRLLINCRLRWALAAGRPIALSTVAPGNVASLRNLLVEGLTVRAIRHKFGGLRYVVRRDLDQPQASVPQRGRWIAVEDVAGQERALEQGEIGWRLASTPADLKIWYGAPSAA